MIRIGWRPRCCVSCGEPLEDWKAPLQPGSFIACFACARIYVVEPDDALTPVVLALEAPELQRVFDDLLAVWWSRQGARTQLAAGAAGGSTGRRAA